jgi:hypothetical protein
MRLTLAIAAICLFFAGSARADGFEQQFFAAAQAAAQQVGEARAHFVPSQASAPAPGQAGLVFAKTIFCPASKVMAELRFYTRLEAVRSLDQLPTDDSHALSLWGGDSPKADESAAGLDDYRSASVSRQLYHYDAWSCDTQDYWFSIATDELAARSADEASRPVRLHLRQETRGGVDFEGELSCVAQFR